MNFEDTQLKPVTDAYPAKPCPHLHRYLTDTDEFDSHSFRSATPFPPACVCVSTPGLWKYTRVLAW